jgi:hypothetical protein
MSRRTHITKDEVTFLINDMLTVLLGSHASGNLKLKHMLVYHSDTARVFKQQEVVWGEVRFI